MSNSVTAKGRVHNKPQRTPDKPKKKSPNRDNDIAYRAETLEKTAKTREATGVVAYSGAFMSSSKSPTIKYTPLAAAPSRPYVHSVKAKNLTKCRNCQLLIQKGKETFTYINPTTGVGGKFHSKECMEKFKLLDKTKKDKTKKDNTKKDKTKK
jgi:MYM-type Zinc finger with FCS sequence motif